MKTAAVLAFAGAAAAQSSSYVYSNPVTAFTTMTDSRGVVTGMPTVNTDVNTNVVTSQPAPNLNVNTNVVTSQPTLVTVPAGMSSGVGSAVPYYTPSASYMPPMGPGATGAPSLAPYAGTPVGTPGTPGTPTGTPTSTPSSSMSSDMSSSTGSSSSSGSRTSSSSRPTSTSGAAAAVQVSGGVLGLVGFIFAAFL